MNGLRWCWFFLIGCIIPSLGVAQHYEWAKRVGSTSNEYANAMVVDDEHNIYIVASIQGSNIDFDPGSGTSALSSNGMTDIAIAKYDSSGNYVWAKQIGGTNDDIGARIEIDRSGNIYIAGWFQSTNVDFDPGTGTALLSTAGGADIFFAKYDKNGNYLWAHRIGSTGISYHDGCHDIFLDDRCNVYITGYFYGTNTDFDPGPGTAYLSSQGNSGDIFFAKFDSAGNYIWAKGCGGSGYEVGNGIIADQEGNVYLTGPFSGSSVDFDPGAGTAYLSSAGGYDIFFARYDSVGNYLWAKRVGGSGDDISGDILLDKENNIYLSTSFHGINVDFDPSARIAYLTSAGGYDVGLAKYDQAGTYLWAYRIGGTSDDHVGQFLLDDTANLFVAGTFSGTAIDFDPGAGKALLNSHGGSDIFVAEYDSEGSYTFAVNFGGSGSDIGSGITVSSSGRIYIAGGFSGSSVDWNPSYQTATLSSAGTTDLFMAKYSTVRGTYFGQTPPGTIPVLFAPGMISASSYEYSATFDTSLSQFYFTRILSGRSTILRSKRTNDNWSPIEIAPFSGTSQDQEPYFTPDGSRFYFGSERTLSGTLVPYHIWYMTVLDTGLTAPVAMGDPFRNTPVMYPTASSNGTLVIGERYENISDSRNGIYFSPSTGGQYLTLQKMSEAINKGYGESHPYIAPDESYILFDATDRPGGYGAGDLYISFRMYDGSWTESVNLGSTINTEDHEGIPYVTPDGQYLVFLRLTGGSDADIYWVSASIIEQFRPAGIDSTRKIVFESWRNGNADLYSMLLDGTQIQRLTSDAGEDRFPSISYDGCKIVFSSNREGNYELYTMYPDGTSVRRISATGDADELTPSWSPDGRKIAYVLSPEDNWQVSEIHVMNANGTGDTAITGNTSGDSHPVWSPDGSRILFYSKRDGHYEVYAMDANGGNQTRLTYSSTNAVNAQWSPDGNKIIYNDVDTSTMTGQVHLMNADGTNDTVLTSSTGINENPCFSPDGTSIVFQSNRDGNYEVYMMNTAGISQYNLTIHESRDSWPCWGILQYPQDTTINVAHMEKWNLISLPLLVHETSKETMFPTSVSQAFSFDYASGGYRSTDAIENGRGYWLKFSSAGAVAIEGRMIYSDTVPVAAGWNLIGSISSPVPVVSISSDPPGIVTSEFFSYNGGYRKSDTIMPGNGYWVKVEQAGLLVLNAWPDVVSMNRIRIVPDTDQPPVPPEQSEAQISTPEVFAYTKNYPNPFNPLTVIRYQFTRRLPVTFKVYNILGEEVAMLVNEMQEAGSRSVTFDAQSLPSGVYYYRLQAGTFMNIKKMIVVK